jgi:type II secretory pathway component PulF
MSQLDSFSGKLACLMFKASTNERRRLWLKLAKLISNGIPIIRALETLVSRREKNKQSTHPGCVAMKQWIRLLDNGYTFSGAIEGWCSNEERMIIYAGEQSGQLEESLQSVAKVLEARKAIKSAVIGGTAYPAFMILMALGGMAMFGYNIVPAFTDAVPGEVHWTGIAGALVSFSDFIQNYMLFILVGLLGLIGVFFYSLPRWTYRFGRVRIIADRYAPYSVYRVVTACSWLISFAAMIQSGVRIENALTQLSSSASPWLKHRIDQCMIGMRSGLNLGESFAETQMEFPDREIIDDMCVYASQSGFDEAIRIIGEERLAEGISDIQGKMRIVFGMSIVLVGALLLFMIGGIFGLQMQMTSALRSM